MGLRLTLMAPGEGGDDPLAAPVRWAFDQPKTTLGRAPSADVVLPDPRVSAEHATLEFVGGALVVVDRDSRNGTAVNGRRVVPGRPKALRSGDRLRLGVVELEVEVGTPVAAATTAEGTAELARRLLREVLDPGGAGGRTPCLRVLNGTGAGTVVELPEAPARVRLGRGEGCDLVLADADASREHCEVVLGVAGARVCDLGSKNGVAVDGQPVHEQRLRDGSELLVGRTVLVFEDPAERAAAAIGALSDDELTDDPLPAAVAPPAPEADAASDGSAPPAPLPAQPAPDGEAARLAPELLVYVLSALVLGVSLFGLFALLGG